ncbi:MADS-box transcription factor plant protein [Dioscorea alata]|uniref:MADS-box transcription factor plant protein n=2 Tax=Dioscorea alata TaxID=55571 RepID=A0ACB7V566_DIOAL|nr:MADS-box transcription factor plant protein [Dioscorea alata]KAH7668538.1 MADS-box transcription factor plant protein [Dioscorea alata]
MGRGKIEIKKIENPTNRQVTYSKRRQGIMKKAKELTVLCDAEVSIVMFSSTGKFAEYCSPSSDTKSMFDRYQQMTGIDLWHSQYERMQSNLNHLKEINHNLRREIRQRMGEELDGLNIDELRGLEQNVDEALKLVRQRKYHVITTQTDTYKKKLKNSHEAHQHLLRELEMREGQPAYGFMDNNDPNNYECAIDLANAAAATGSHVYAYRVQPNQPNLHGIMAYNSNDLRLA